MQDDRKWNDKLNDLLAQAIKECGTRYPLELTVLIDAALRGERKPRRDALAKKQIRREICVRLRRWPAPDELPLIPGLFDGYVQTERGLVHTSKLSMRALRDFWRARSARFKRQADTLMTRAEAIDKMLLQLKNDEEEPA